MKKRISSFSFASILITTAIWGSTLFIIKDSLVHIHPVTLVAYRFSLAAIIFGCIVFIRKEKFWQHAKHGFILGVFVWIIYLSQTLGLQYTTASNTGFIIGLFIIFVPLFNFLIFRRKATVLQLIALGIAVIGLWFLTGGLKDLTTGDVLALVSAICISLNILFVDKFVKEKKSVTVLGFQQFVTTALLSYITAFVLHIPLTPISTNVVFPIVYLAICGSAIAQGLQLFSQKKVTALTASLLFSTEPVFAALFAWTLGGELFIPAKAIGGLFIIVAILLSELPLTIVKNKLAVLYKHHQNSANNNY